MELSWLQSLVLGLVSGLTRLLPLSSQAHRAFLRLCFGIEQEGSLFLLLCNIATLAVVAFGMRAELSRLSRARRLLSGSSRRRRQQPDPISACTLRHQRSAAVICVVMRLFSRQMAPAADRLYLLCGGLLAGGLILWMPNLLRSGNKDSRNMLRIDGYLMGLAAGLSVIPGISLVGAAASVGIARGVDKGYALHFSVLLLIPALAVDAALEVVALIAAGSLPGLMGFLSALAGAALCAVGSWLGLRIMQSMARSKGFAAWSYYLWGMALLCFMLFLIL